MPPLQLHVDPAPGLVDLVPGTHHAVVRADQEQDQQDDDDDHDDGDEHGSGLLGGVRNLARRILGASLQLLRPGSCCRPWASCGHSLESRHAGGSHAPPRITPSLVISLIALSVALSGTALAANGDGLLLGGPNTATAKTTLTANFNGAALQLTNTKPYVAATALNLHVAANRPPLITNSSGLVANLNADQLDGIDSVASCRPVARGSATPWPSPSAARRRWVRCPDVRPPAQCTHVQRPVVPLSCLTRQLARPVVRSPPSGQRQRAGRPPPAAGCPSPAPGRRNAAIALSIAALRCVCAQYRRRL